MIKQLFLAIQFLTILPIRVSGAVRDEDLAGSMAYYPAIGAGIGALSAVVYRAVLHVSSFPVAVVTALVALIIFSGALHLDGFADACDGLYAGHDRERALAVMKDSHNGAMAIVGVFCLLALKIVLLGNLEASKIPFALVLAPALGRTSMVWLCATSTYARPKGGTGSPYIGRVNRLTMWVALVVCGALAFLLFRERGLLVMAGAALFTLVFRLYVERRIGGMTGDTLGACSELVEVLVLGCL